MYFRRRYLSIALGALLAKTSLAQDTDKESNLRKSAKNEPPASSTGDAFTLDAQGEELGGLLPLGSPTTLRVNDAPQRIVIYCHEGQDKDECLEQILDSFPAEDTKVLHYLETANAYALSIRGGTQPSMMDALEFDSDSDPIRRPLHIPESLELHRELQVGGQSTPYGINMVKAPEAWAAFGTQGENVKVCVMDTGLRSSHNDFNQNRLQGYNGPEAITPWNNDGEGHGTHVTGTIAASDNNFGVVGVAPGVEIFTVRVFDDNGVFGSDIVAAAEQCRNGGANVISMSLGGGQGSRFERNIFESLYGEGIIAVAAAGNSGGTDFSYPASYEIVVSVAAVSSNGNLASFSTRNSRVDVAAPGVNVQSTWNNGRYASLSGTSMATPHVSGVIALMMSHVPNATPAQIISSLTATAANPETSGRNDGYGHGIVNALAAIQDLEDAVGGGNNGGGGNGGNNGGGGNGGNNGGGGNGGNNGGGGNGGDNGNGNGNGGNEPSCQVIDMQLRTDRFGYETSYYLTDENRNQLWGRFSLWSNRLYSETACVDPSGCYRFQIGDRYGDGITGDGLTLSYAGEVVYQGGNFGSGGYRDFGNGCP